MYFTEESHSWNSPNKLMFRITMSLWFIYPLETFSLFWAPGTNNSANFMHLNGKCLQVHRLSKVSGPSQHSKEIAEVILKWQCSPSYLCAPMLFINPHRPITWFDHFYHAEMSICLKKSNNHSKYIIPRLFNPPMTSLCAVVLKIENILSSVVGQTTS